MDILSINNDELFNVMQSTNLITVLFEGIDVWTVFPILYTNTDSFDILADVDNIGSSGGIGNKVRFKFQKQGYEYMVNGEVVDKSINTPQTLTIRYDDAKKYYNLRKHFRFDTNLGAKFLYTDMDTGLGSGDGSQNTWVGGVVKNISRGGAMFIFDKELEFNLQSEMEIKFSSGNEFKASVKILRKSKTSNGSYSYGVQFDRMSENDNRVLSEELSKFEREYFKSLYSLREYQRPENTNFDTRILFISNDMDESFDIRESLIRIGSENFDVMKSFKHYHGFLVEEKPKVIIIDTNVLNDEVENVIDNICADFEEINIILLILPIELQNADILKFRKQKVDILFKPLIYNEFEDKIIRYL